VTTLEVSRTASSVSTRVRHIYGFQRCVFPVSRTSGAVRRIAANLSRRSLASRSAASVGTDGGATGLTYVADVVVTTWRHHSMTPLIL
jgi:hypothetical protein